MEKALILETTFLIDLQREVRRKKACLAQKFLEDYAGSLLYITFTIAGELAAGISLRDKSKWEDFLKPFYVLPWTTDVSWEYGEAYRYLSENGLLIGSNDLWIAATALVFQMPLVTRNIRHYQRVPGLKLISYKR
jgi:predicted nucleic acid-binding protein